MVNTRAPELRQPTRSRDIIDVSEPPVISKAQKKACPSTPATKKLAKKLVSTKTAPKKPSTTKVKKTGYNPLLQ